MKPLARKDQLLVEELIDECVVYDNSNKKAHSLNSTVAWIWRHCDGATEPEQMAALFEREFGCSDSLDVVLAGIQQLQAADLLVAAPGESATPLISRRSVVAAGSALAPAIASILVPTAAAARSRDDEHDHDRGRGNDRGNGGGNGRGDGGNGRGNSGGMAAAIVGGVAAALVVVGTSITRFAPRSSGGPGAEKR